MVALAVRRPTLRLCLIDAREVHPEAFRIFASRTLRLPAGEAHLHVIGASSLVIVRTAEVQLAELIACAGADPFPPCHAAAELHETAGPPAGVDYRGEGAAYRARLWSAPLGEGPGAPGLPVAVEHFFPGPGSPLTRIEAGCHGDVLRLRTRHDYPEAGMSVWSESEWIFSHPASPVPRREFRTL